MSHGEADHLRPIDTGQDSRFIHNSAYEYGLSDEKEPPAIVGPRGKQARVARQCAVCHGRQSSDSVKQPNYEITGFGFSVLMPRSLIALSTTDFSILPSAYSSCSVASVMKRESTSKKSRKEARPSLRPNPSVPREARCRGIHLLTVFGSVFR